LRRIWSVGSPVAATDFANFFLVRVAFNSSSNARLVKN